MDYREDPSLRVRKLFLARLTAGIPAMVFFFVVASSVGVFFLSNFLLSVIWGAFFFVLMYFIHRNDPQALVFWVSALRRPARWVVGDSPAIKMIVVDEFDGDLFTPYTEFTQVNFSKGEKP